MQLPVRIGAGLLSAYSVVLAAGTLVAIVIFPPIALLSIPLAINAVLALRVCGTDLRTDRLPNGALAVALAVNLWGLTYFANSDGNVLALIATGGFVAIAGAAFLMNWAFRSQRSAP